MPSMMLDDLDLVQLGYNVLRPKRERLIEVLGIVTGATSQSVTDALKAASGLGRKIPFEKLWTTSKITDPQVAFETLSVRGVIPDSWVTSNERDFLDEKLVPKTVIPTLEMVVALASDVPGVMHAEMMAREVSSRLSHWLQPADSTVQKMSWRIANFHNANIRNQPWPSMALGVPNQGGFTGIQAISLLTRSIIRFCGFGDTARELRGEVTEEEKEVQTRAREALATVQRCKGATFANGLAGSDAFYEITFRWLAKRRESTLNFLPTSESDSATPTEDTTVSFHSLRSPFLPSLYIWDTGYVLEDITRHRFTLFCPRGNWSR